ncbi:MAG: aldehyde dehydrogenase family protein, partial [Okeania sp. SIO1H5]|uniref:aldehyde dehydrogenase family protein n=1 Tax=Okeania sp. SIO1H5 TaxID=2607777 RepID=UPI0013B8B0D4
MKSGIGNWIAGRWMPSDGVRFQSICPSTGTPFWEGKEATEAEVKGAVEAAGEAFAAWSQCPIEERCEIINNYQRLLEQQKESIANWIGLETGKPKWEALTEVQAMIGKVEHSIDSYHKRCQPLAYERGGVRSMTRF